MAFGNRFRFRFDSVHGVEYNIYILKDGYTGTCDQRALGRDPVLKKQKNGPICGTSLELYAQCEVDGEFAELYTSDPKQFRVDVYRQVSGSNVLIWRGFVSTELYSEPSIYPPYDVQIVATDGLGELKLNNYVAQGEITLKALFAYLLSFTGSDRGMYFVTNLKETGAAKTQMLDWTININFLAGETCYDVLTKLLDSLHATITSYKQMWLVVRETDIDTLLNGSGNISVVYLAQGSASNSTLYDVFKTVGQMGVAAMFPNGYLSTSIEPARKSVLVEAPFYIIPAFQYGNFDESLIASTHWDRDTWEVIDTIDMQYHRATMYKSAEMLFYIGSLVDGDKYGWISQTLGEFNINGLTIDIDVHLKNAHMYSSNIELLLDSKVRVLLEITDNGSTYRYYGDDTPQFYSLGKTNPINSGIPEHNLHFSIGPRQNAHVGGTAKLIIEGVNIAVYSVNLTFSREAGYKDTIHIDNGARGDADDVEILGGRIFNDAIKEYDGSFYQGLWKYNGNLLISFQDSYHSGGDFLSTQALDRAISVAYARTKTEGVIDMPAVLSMMPLLIRQQYPGQELPWDSWVETFEWNLRNEDVQISALSLPNAAITVESETVVPMDGTAGTSYSGGGSSGGGGGYSGGVSSVDMTVPTGFQVSGNPITSSGTLALSFASGYSLPTTTKQSDWDTAYNMRHSHSNKSALDEITATKISEWDSAASHEHTHSNKSVLDGITSTKVSNWDAAYTDKHTHSNKSVLDGITSQKVSNWDAAYTDKHTHSNKSVLDGITSQQVSHWNSSITEVTTAMVIDALGYIPADVDDLIRGAGLHAPTLRIFRGYNNASGQSEFSPYMEVKHPLLSVAGLNAQPVLMVWSKRRGRKGATSTKRYPTYTSGWGEVRGRLATTAAFILTNGIATLDSIRQFILNKCLCGSDLSRAQMEAMTLATFRSYTPLVHKFGFKGKHSQQINDFIAKRSRLFGVAIRYENPEWAAHVTGTVAETTREVDDGTTHGKVQRYFYTDVAAFRVHVNPVMDGLWEIGFQMQPINKPKR